MSGENRTTTDHDEIRRWAEERGGKPAAGEGPGSGADPRTLRIAFPGRPESDDDSLEEVSWDEWFRAFDENELAFVCQERTAGGEPSRFNKLVSRDSGRSGWASVRRAPRAVRSSRTRRPGPCEPWGYRDVVGGS